MVAQAAQQQLEFMGVPSLHADGAQRMPQLRLLGADPYEEGRVVVARRLKCASIRFEVGILKQCADFY